MWTRIRFVIAGESAESWSDALLAAGAVSVDASDADADSEAECALFGEPGEPPAPPAWPRTLLTALFPRDEGGLPASAEEILGTIGTLGADPPGLPSPTGFECDTLPEEDWVQAVQREFTPFAIGRRLWITPSWHADATGAPDGRHAIVLDPGLAFGTGSHPTTRLCLEWLDEHIVDGTSLIDYGCGSGILAIAAARLGASPVTALDIDPQALTAARRNARDNRVQIELHSGESAVLHRADVVVANILANPLRVLAPLLESLVVPGGSLVLAGLLDRQADEIARHYRDSDLSRWRSLDGWTCLAGKRRR